MAEDKKPDTPRTESRQFRDEIAVRYNKGPTFLSFTTEWEGFSKDKDYQIKSLQNDGGKRSGYPTTAKLVNDRGETQGVNLRSPSIIFRREPDR